jgi:hypothetical protein
VTAYGKLPIAFEANRGQTDPRVKFLARGHGYSLFLTPTAAVLSLRTPPDSTPPSVSGPQGQGTTPVVLAKAPFMHSPTLVRSQPQAASAPLRMELVGANPAARVTGIGELPGKSNYFIGNDPARWHTNVPTYAKVRYEDVYPGVDLVYYGNQRQLEYDFVVAPGADPKAIRMSFGGLARARHSSRVESRDAAPLQVDADGNLVLRTSGGEVQFHKPIVYQQVGDARQEIAGCYVLRGKHQIGFEVAAYDAGKPLIIDPVLSYSTYLGGNGGDSGNAIAVDSGGNAYITGSTASPNFPTKNALQPALGGGNNAFIAKLDPTGSALVYSTYLGGNSGDFGNAIAVDASGNAYVTGETASTNFPTKNALQSASGGSLDAFVAKLDPTGSTLIYSTYLGGSGGDLGNGIAVDGAGNAYITGSTASPNFPTKNALQPALGGGSDAFIAKLDPTGSSLVYSTYLGGSSSDSGGGIAVDASGNAYVTGETFSTNFPTKNPFQAACGACSSGQPSAFVSKVNAAGSALVYSTFLGGSGNGTDGDFGNGIAVDPSNNAYVTGFTSSTDFPLASPIQASLVLQTCFDSNGYPFQCGNTAFVTELNAAGSVPVYSTYLGASGGGFEDGRGIAVDTGGNAYVTGTANSNFLLTPGSFQTSPGGNGDAFVAKISPNDAPGFSLSSFSLSFPDEGIGGTTPALQITLANTGSVTLTITSIVPSGDFAATNTCGSSLTGGTSCTISVTFKPTAAGARTGTIKIMDSAASSPQTITLSGNGIAGLAATLTPTNLSFGNQTQGTISAPQTVTFQNTGSATLTLNGISIVGTNPSDFTFTFSAINCNPSQSLAAGASCTISMAFAPQVVGNLSATLQILDNSAQSPRNVPLTGAGLAPPTVALSPTSLDFAAQIVGSTSSGQSVRLTTSGSGTLAISSISPSGDFATTSNCAASVPGGASCTITVTFTPTAAGSKTGTLVIADNAADSPQMVPLTGLGVDFSISPAAGSPNSVTVTAGQPATYTVSVAGTSGFSGTVSLSCTSPAVQTTCGVLPNPLPVNGTTPVNATVTVTTAARSALPPRWRPPMLPPGLRVGLPWLLLLLGLVTLTMALRRQSGGRRAWVGLAAMLMAAALFFGCGGGGGSTPPPPPPPQGTPAGTYPITVNAISGAATRTTTLTLKVL